MFQPESLPPELVPILTAADALHTDHLAAASPEERAAWLVGLRRIIDRCEGEFLQVLSVFDSHGDGDVLHAARSTASWLRGALSMAPGDANERVRLARRAHEDLKVTVELLNDNRITFDHVRAIGAAVRSLPSEAVAAGVEIMNELATHTEPATVRAAGRRLRETVDPDGALAAADKDFTRRWVCLSPMLDGMTHLEGLLDPEAASALTNALTPFLVPCGPDDERTAAQRRADGLNDLARLALDHRKVGNVGGNPPRLQVACDLSTLLGAEGAPPAELPRDGATSEILSRPSFERLSCDAVVARVLIGPDSIPVDFGRDHRLFSSSQRNALASRDFGCRFPQCHFPPAFTDAHHLTSWVTGGETSLSNGLLLCRYHHRKVHEGGWEIRPDAHVRGANGLLTFVGPLGQRLESEVGRAKGAAENWSSASPSG